MDERSVLPSTASSMILLSTSMRPRDGGNPSPEVAASKLGSRSIDMPMACTSSATVLLVEVASYSAAVKLLEVDLHETNSSNASMAKQTLPPPPPSLKLTPDEMRAGIRRLELKIAEVEAFDPNAFDGDDSKLFQLHASIDDALSRTFGRGTPEYNLYDVAASFSYPLNYVRPPPLTEKRDSLAKCKRNSLALLAQAVRSLNEQLEESTLVAPPSSSPEAKSRGLSNKVFIVHGHDNEAKQTVARFINQLGLREVILHEQVSQNRTIIEKLEANSDVGFAVVLLTPDDEGRTRGETEFRLRARQNVVAELGYFVGHLKRDRVCALVKGEMELPSDFSGVVYVSFDAASNHWKVELARELNAAGYKLKMEALLGRN
jgi:predicted nucleotide-binding protein